VKSPSRRRVAVAALLLAPVLSACGFNVQTDQVYQPAEGVNNRSGQVDILNALVVSGTDGVGTFAGTLVNNNQTEDDELTSITGDGVQVALADSVTIPAAGLVNLANEGGISVIGKAVNPGGFVTLTFVFNSGQSTQVKMPVVVHAGDYAKVPLPGSKATAAPSGAQPSDTASPAAQ
jgi:hypothetical protein